MTAVQSNLDDRIAVGAGAYICTVGASTTLGIQVTSWLSTLATLATGSASIGVVISILGWVLTAIAAIYAGYKAAGWIAGEGFELIESGCQWISNKVSRWFN